MKYNNLWIINFSQDLFESIYFTCDLLFIKINRLKRQQRLATDFIIITYQIQLISMWERSIKILLVIFVAVGYVNTVMITRIVAGRSQFCINEDIPQHTLVRIKVFSESIFNLDIKHTGKVVLTAIIKYAQVIKSYTTQGFGTHQICFTNQDQNQHRIKFQLAVGRRANDYTSHFDNQNYIDHLKNQGKIAQQFIQDIVAENSEGMQIIVAETDDSYRFACLYAFSTFFVVATVTLTFVQYKFIRRHLHSRKYI